jgi:DNA-binding transcriptional MocR family regulator
MTDKVATRLAANAGVVVRPLADFFAGRPDRSALLLGFAGFNEDELTQSVRVLAKTLSRK